MHKVTAQGVRDRLSGS